MQLCAVAQMGGKKLQLDAYTCFLETVSCNAADKSLQEQPRAAAVVTA